MCVYIGTMIVHRFTMLFFAFCAIGNLLPATASAHGGVVEENDLCIIKVNYLRAHFKVYQPREAGHEQYCEDLPAAGESVFVMEYQHDLLSSMPIDFRIVRDVTGKGRFARLEDVNAIADLEAATVYYRSAAVDPDVYTVVHAFEEEGDYIGIVSATHADTGKVYAAVFPFEVGFTGFGYWPFFIGMLVLIQLQYFVMSGRAKRWIGGRAATSMVALLLAMPLAAHAGDLMVSYSTPDGEPTINRMHRWIVHVEDARGEPVLGAAISVAGGMPEHDHGLPTAPRVTAELGGGDYQLDGVRFHMTGHWEIELTIKVDGKTSIVVLPLQL